MYDISFRQIVLALAILFVLTSVFIDPQVWHLIMDSVRNYW